MKLRTLFNTFLALAFSVSLVLAEEALPIPRLTDGKVSVSIFQPPSEFWPTLNKLDAKTRYLSDPIDGWESFFNSDIWIFFVSGADELTQLPSIVVQVFQQGGISNLNVVNRADVVFTGQRNVTIFLFDVSQYSDVSVVGCKSAVSVYSVLAGYGESQKAPLFGSCDTKAGK